VHPITHSRHRLTLYAAAWIPVTGILVVTLTSRDDLRLGEGILLGGVLGVLYATIGLPLWYFCRAHPLRGANAVSALLPHAVTAVLFASLLQFAVRLLARTTASLGHGWSGLSERLAPHVPMLFLLGILIYFLLVAFYYLITAVEAGKDAERHRDRLRAMAGDAELRALRAQLNPHFLFNSLNSISSLTGSDPPKAREMCVRLADFFRKSVGLGDKPSVTLSEEIELLSHYLAVEKIRLGERLRVELAVDSEVRKTELPPLLLQPLVENAVLHGIATLTEGGTLRIRAERLHGRLRVQVDNPYDPHAPARRGSGRGIENVRRRVAAHFGTDGRMTVDARDDRYSVVLSLPLERP
jgi:hypothetical protein